MAPSGARRHCPLQFPPPASAPGQKAPSGPGAQGKHRQRQTRRPLPQDSAEPWRAKGPHGSLAGGLGLCSVLGVNTPHGPPQGMLAWSPGRPKHSTGEGSWVGGTGILRPRSRDSSSLALWRQAPSRASGRPQGLGFCRCSITESRHCALPQPSTAPPWRVTSSVGAQGPSPGLGMFSGAGGWEEPVSEATHCRPGGSACRAAGAPPTPSPGVPRQSLPEGPCAQTRVEGLKPRPRPCT